MTISPRNTHEKNENYLYQRLLNTTKQKLGSTENNIYYFLPHVCSSENKKNWYTWEGKNKDNIGLEGELLLFECKDEETTYVLVVRVYFKKPII
jgi:hypothetical protein